MKLLGEYVFVYYRIIDYLNYCTFSPLIFDKALESLIIKHQEQIHEEMTENLTNNDEIRDFLEAIYIEIDAYRDYMLENAVEISKHNREAFTNITQEIMGRNLLFVLEKIANYSVNICYVLRKIREKGKAIKNYIFPNDTINKEQILDLDDFVKLKEEVLSVLYDIYEL